MPPPGRFAVSVKLPEAPAVWLGMADTPNVSGGTFPFVLIGVPTAVQPAPLQVPGAAADGPKTLIVIGPIGPAPPESVAVIDAAGIAVLVNPPAGAETVSVG